MKKEGKKKNDWMLNASSVIFIWYLKLYFAVIIFIKLLDNEFFLDK